MKTPIADFVQRYAQGGTARFHMPGHKGKTLLGCEALDITEIKDADDLFAPDGIIAQSEANAAALFGAGHTLYSTEGATLPIKAMLALATQKVPKSATRVRILAARNAHKSFLYGCALLDLDVDFLYGEQNTHLCACRVTPAQVAQALSSAATPYCAVYITSPDYLGNVADIAGISRVCKAHGVPLLVDNAHGAYLAFSDPVCHPIALGATMCADSAHKTLPALTGAAYLHIAKDADPYFAQHARGAMALFASSSPSYLILQSLDLCNDYLEKQFKADLAATAAKLATLRQTLASAGYDLHGDEAIKLTVDGRARGFDGAALAAALRANGVEPEFTDRDCVVLMCTPQNTVQELARVEAALTALPARAPLLQKSLSVPQNAQRALTVREAILSPAKALPVQQALGQICASPAVSCPPAIPIVISGERIGAEAVALFEAYGIDSVDVVSD